MNKKKSAKVLGHCLRLSIFVFFAGIFQGCSIQQPSFRGTVIAEPEAAPEISLGDQEGNIFRLSDQKGNVVLLFFGFSHCPEACPMTLSTWKQIESRLNGNADKVKFVFVSVDPERDDAESLGSFVSAYSQRIISLHGSAEELTPIHRSYGVFIEKDNEKISGGSYLINHTTSIILIDQQGHWRLNYPYGVSADDIVLDIEILLK
jgi:protein SCO1/2